MKKKRTKVGIAISRAIWMSAGMLSIISSINEIFGFTQLIEENGELLWNIAHAAGSFLMVWRKWVLIIFFVALVVYIFFRRAQKIELEDRLTRDLSWFDAQRRNTQYSGGEEYLYELKRFLKQEQPGLSWWAVTGVAGIGKTRLVIEALRDEDLSNADVQWLRRPDDYRECVLKEKADAILERTNLRNIIIAEDAQIYMDNIGTLIEYIMGKQVSELGKHKIRILLLIRMGEDENLSDRYNQLASRTRHSVLQQTRFSTFAKELRVEKYNEKDIAQIVKTFVINTKKNRNKEKPLTAEQVVEIQTKTIEVLASEKMDPKHMRPLFAMFIADALLSGKDPMSWDKIAVLEYAVIIREDEFIKMEVDELQQNENRFVFEKIRGIICLSIIRSGLKMSELDGIKDELEEELKLSGTGLGVKDFLKEMQLLGKDGIIRISMPDILSEYYVLRILVLNTDDDDFRWVIERMHSSLEGVEEFREKVLQNFGYMYDKQVEDKLDDFYFAFFERCNNDLAYEIIAKLINKKELRDSDEIILHEAIRNQIRNKENVERIALMLFAEEMKASELEKKQVYLSELNHLLANDDQNIKFVFLYSNALVNILRIDPEMEEKQRRLSELKQLSEKYKEYPDIVKTYCDAKVSMIRHVSEIEEKKLYLSELKQLSEKYEDYPDIVKTYCDAIVSMISYVSEIEEKKQCLSELKQLLDKYAGYPEIAQKYADGLRSIFFEPLKIEDKRQYLLDLESLVKENKKDSQLIEVYRWSLAMMLEVDPEIEEKRKYLSELETLFKLDGQDAPLLGSGLVFMLRATPEMSEKEQCLLKLKQLSEEKAETLFLYSMELFDLLNFVSEIGEKRRYLSKLRRLSEKHPDERSIIREYCKGLNNMLIVDIDRSDYYLSELYKLLSDVAFAQYIADKEPDIIIGTRTQLIDFEKRKYFDKRGQLESIFQEILI